MKQPMQAHDLGWVGVFWLIATWSLSLVCQFAVALWRLAVWAGKKTFSLHGKYADYQAFQATKEALDAAARPVEPTVSAASAAPQPAPQPAAQTGQQAAAQRSPLNSTVDEPQARVVGRAAEPEAKTSKHYKSGLNAGDLVIADSHATEKIGGRWYRFSMYRDAGRVVRYDVKDKVLLKDFHRSTAAAHKVPFSLEQAILFTSREVLAARKAGGKSAKGKAVKLTPALPQPGKEQASEAAPAPSPVWDEPPPWTDMPPEYESYNAYVGEDERYGSVAAKTPPAAARPIAARPVADDQPMDSDVVEHEGECSWENNQYQGTIEAQYMSLRKPKGREPYNIFTMLLKLGDGTKKEFTGVELQGRSMDLQLAKGDTIEIRKGIQHYSIVKSDSSEHRKRNVYAIRVIAKAMNRKFG